MGGSIEKGSGTAEKMENSVTDIVGMLGTVTDASEHMQLTIKKAALESFIGVVKLDHTVWKQVVYKADELLGAKATEFPD